MLAIVIAVKSSSFPAHNFYYVMRKSFCWRQAGLSDCSMLCTKNELLCGIANVTDLFQCDDCHSWVIRNLFSPEAQREAVRFFTMVEAIKLISCSLLAFMRAIVFLCQFFF